MSLPPATLLEGPRGKDGQFTWRGIVLGNIDQLPRYHIDSVTGLRDRPDTEDNRAPATGRPGELLYDSLIRARPIVVEGRILGSSPVDLAQAVSALLSATADPAQTTLMIAPLPSRGGVVFGTAARVQTCVISPTFDKGPNARPTPWQHDFVVSWRTTLPIYGAYPVKTATHASTIDAFNAGTAPTDLALTIEVPTGNPTVTITNTTTGRVLTFKLVPAGTLVINFADRTVILNNVNISARYLDDLTSDWWNENVPGLQPGSNVLTLSGGTSFSVTWADAVY